MKFVSNQGHTNPEINLSIEEFLLRNIIDEPEILLFYINEPSVIIGRNQNSIEEIDPDYIDEKGVNVVRRLSGGGAVYHDLGNLNFSYISSAAENLHNYAHFIEPVVQTLNELGVPAELRGKSDVFVEGKKISGNAQYASRGRMVSHGTILFDTNIQHMMQSLNPRQVTIESSAVQSVRNFVTNVKEYVADDFTIEDLKDALLKGIFGTVTPAEYLINSTNWKEIEAIRSQRFGTWNWNYGRTPNFNIQKTGEFPAGKIDVRINVKSGIINEIRFFGTYTFSTEIESLENSLVGKRYDAKSLDQVINKIDLESYFGDIPAAEIKQLLY
ncbi:MAG: lipoate--protein ligase [Chloroflexota bacterium]